MSVSQGSQKKRDIEVEVKRDGLQTWTMTQNQQAPPGSEGSEGAFQDVLKVVTSEPLGAKMGRQLAFECWQQDITDEDVLQSSFNHFLIDAAHDLLLELISTVGICGSTTLFGEP